jgi:shikimate dehydrogenase
VTSTPGEARGSGAIAGDTAVTGIIGRPVAHSLSPALQNAAFAALGLNWVYVALDVDPEELVPALRGVRVLGFRGLNVTAPHKLAAATLVDRLDGTAAALGLVNTIVFARGETVGHSTDGAGFLAACKDHGVEIEPGLRAVVVGAGGAGMSISHALLERGARVVLANRDARRLSQAADRLVPLASGSALAAVPLADRQFCEELSHADLLVNATTDPLPAAIEVERLPRSARVTDLAYRVSAGSLVPSARSRGLQAWDGLGMLVHQGALSFTLWTGHDPPLAAMARAVGYMGGPSPIS